MTTDWLDFIKVTIIFLGGIITGLSWCLILIEEGYITHKERPSKPNWWQSKYIWHFSTDKQEER